MLIFLFYQYVIFAVTHLLLKHPELNIEVLPRHLHRYLLLCLHSVHKLPDIFLRFTGTTGTESGTVRVFSQETEHGTQVESGTVITVRLGDTAVRD